MGRAEFLVWDRKRGASELISAPAVLCDLGQVLHLFVPSFPLL